MIKITITLDYDSWDKFWKSCWGGKIAKVLASAKCICWSGETIEEN